MKPSMLGVLVGELVGVLVGVGLVLAGCGDNSKRCGDGTNDENGDGICEPDDRPSICGDGTVLDPVTQDCTLDPNVCGSGTVLIDGQCKDPAEGVDVDLLEAQEPNGFEPDATPAGVITLKPVGEGFVIHGCVAPIDTNSPDLDRYVLAVTGPTLLHVTADGVEGLAGGFIVLDASGNPLLDGWMRLGINLNTDTSKREIFLPTAGTYDFIVTDSRTLFPITQGNPQLLAAGDPGGTTCYYVTLTARTLSPTGLDLATGDTGTIGEELKFYSVALPDGFTSIEAVIDPEDLDNDGLPDIDSRAASSIVVLNNVALRQIDDANAASPISTALVGGIQPGDDPLIVLDYVWNMTLGPADFAIRSTATLDSQALSTTGATVTATSNGRFFIDPTSGEQVLGNLNLFHFDITGTGEVDGFDLVSSIQLAGVIADGDGRIVSRLTGLAGDATSSTTFAAYKGLVRTPLPGRYYLVAFAPRNPAGSAFGITSTISPLTLDPLALDAPASQSVNAFNSNALLYDPATEPWQLFDATGTSTGTLAVDLFDPATTFGRLDTLAIRTGGGAGTAGTLPNDCIGCDVTVAHRFAFNPTGSTPAGRILQPPTPSFLVKVNPAIATGTRNFTLAFATRVYTDLGTLATGTTTTIANQTIDAANRERRYYLETAPGNVVTITATPAGAFNAEIAQIDTREADVRVVDTTALPNPETLAVGQGPLGFTAFKVRGGTAASTGNYTVAVQIDPPFQYTVADTTTAFADACTGGTVVALVDDGSGFGGNDDGLSAAAGITLPAGFTFFGAAATRVRVSSNGFLTLDLAITDSQPVNQTLPATTGQVHIAPYWDDLASITVCRKTVGGKLVFQWTGDDFLATVQFQAILDPTDDSIEFVWGPSHAATGARATIGIQGNLGATQLTFDQPVVTPGSAKKLTPPP